MKALETPIAFSHQARLRFQHQLRSRSANLGAVLRTGPRAYRFNWNRRPTALRHERRALPTKINYTLHLCLSLPSEVANLEFPTPQ